MKKRKFRKIKIKNVQKCSNENHKAKQKHVLKVQIKIKDIRMH